MRQLFLRFALLSLICAVAAVNLFAQTDRLRNAVDSSQRVALHGFVHPAAKPSNDAGAVADSFVLPAITMAFQPSAAQQAALDQLLAQQQDPSSPNFHKWLTPEQYAAQFGVSASDLQQVQTWLTGQGFRVGN